MLSDLSCAARRLLRDAGFAVPTIATLALGMGLLTVPFIIFNALILRPVGVKDPHSLHQITWRSDTGERSRHSWLEFTDLCEQRRVFSNAGAYVASSARIGDDRWVWPGLFVSGDYLPMLSNGALLGRLIEPRDAEPSVDGAVIVLGHHLWRSQFGSDPHILGRKLSVNQHPFEVIGVMREEFEDPVGALFPGQFWIPLNAYARISGNTDPLNVDDPTLRVIARLRPEIQQPQAEAALLPFARRAMGKSTARAALRNVATRTPLGPASLAVTPIFFVFGLLLLVCCANCGNMVLAYTLRRRREVGVRLALGASRARVARGVSADVLLVCLVGGLCGTLLASWVVSGTALVVESVYRAIIPARTFQPLPAMPPFVIDYRVLGFVLCTVLFVTLAVGLTPAIQATRADIVSALRGESRGGDIGRLRGLLLASQVMACVFLLVCTGILLQTVRRVQTVDWGYDLHGVVQIYGQAKKPPPRLSQTFKDQKWADVAIAWRGPLSDYSELPVRGSHELRSRMTRYDYVSPSYFSVLQIPLLRGRTFTDAEAHSEAAVTIVSEGVARRAWPEGDPLGKTLFIDVAETPPRTTAGVPLFRRAVVVGIVSDVATGDAHNPTFESVYFPASEAAVQSLYLLVRGTRAPQDTLRAVETIVDSEYSNLSLRVMTLDRVESLRNVPLRTIALISSILGMLALLLTISGFFGVVSYLTSQRTREIAIRISLGAKRMDIVRMIIVQSLRQAVVGLGLGLALALTVSGLLASKSAENHGLFDLTAYSGALALVMLAVALAALGAGTARYAIQSH